MTEPRDPRTPADAPLREEPRRQESLRDKPRERADRPVDQRPTDDRPRQDLPPETETGGHGITAGTWIALILGAIVLILLLIFIIQNNVATSFAFFTWQFSLPLGVAMLLAAIAGALVMALVGSVRMVQQSMTIRKLRRNEQRIRQTLR